MKLHLLIITNGIINGACMGSNIFLSVCSRLKTKETREKEMIPAFRLPLMARMTESLSHLSTSFPHGLGMLLCLPVLSNSKIAKIYTVLLHLLVNLVLLFTTGEYHCSAIFV